MKEKPKKERRRLGPGGHLVVQFVVNTVGVVIASVSLVYLVFAALGDESGMGDWVTVQAFLLIFIPFFTMIQPVGVVATTRREFLRGVWEWKSDERGVEPDGIINPWQRTGVLPLIAGIIVAVAICSALPVVTAYPNKITCILYSRLTINLLAIIPTAVLSCIFIKLYLYKDRVSFAAALAKLAQDSPEPFRRYFFIEHAGPWMPLQAVINAGIGVRIFMAEAAKAGGEVAATMLATDTFIMGWILLFFLWLGSQNQVRADVHLGRVAKDQGKGYAVPLMLIFFIVPSVLMAVAVWGILFVLGIESMSVVTATVAKAVLAMVFAAIGCWLGIWWGARRETKIINEISSS